VTTQAQWQQQLDEALAARHTLLIGKQPTELMIGDRRVRYGDATSSLARLDAYIADLRRQLAGFPLRRGRLYYGVPE
jgi:hypothetical protein